MIVRFDYGSVVPWVSREEDGRLQFIAGSERLLLDTTVPMRGEDLRSVGEFTLKAGDEVSLVLNWSPSYRAPPQPLHSGTALKDVGSPSVRLGQAIHSPKKLGRRGASFAPDIESPHPLGNGADIAAGTTSLPEQVGGPRNWDYRYCWLRDATFTLYALIGAGFLDEAKSWHEWLLRAAAGVPDDLQTIYGVAGERRLDEYEVSWLPGYESSTPVRVGNAAVGQRQLDIYGEVLDAFYLARRAGPATSAATWALEVALVSHVEKIWREPDEGIWEVRGGPRHFTHSKVMAWVALDRAVRSIEEFGLEGPLERWRSVRSALHQDISEYGFDRKQNAFVQSFGATALDASLLLVPLVGFCRLMIPASAAPSRQLSARWSGMDLF